MGKDSLEDQAGGWGVSGLGFSWRPCDKDCRKFVWEEFSNTKVGEWGGS
jgi:hypothetical protein